MSKYHINEAGNAGVCNAQSGGCPFGGELEHYDTPEDARTAYEKVMSEGASWNSISRKQVKEQTPEEAMAAYDATMREALATTGVYNSEPDEDGSYQLPAGDYVVINTERVDYDTVEQEKLVNQLRTPSENAHQRVFGENTAYSGTVDGEPVMANTEEWSGVTNALVSRKFYDRLVAAGVAIDTNEENFITLDSASKALPLSVEDAKALGRPLTNDDGETEVETLFWSFASSE